MRLNEFIKIVGKKVILVPYEDKHVPKYNNWMQDPELLELTSSDRLTLDDEYGMQLCWREDDDKCTFLVASREVLNETGDEIAALVGDTNIFLRTDDDGHIVGEVEIMIAEKDAQGRGFGWEAMLLMIKYGLAFLNITKFEAKIRLNNLKSLSMFKKMHFQEVSVSSAFQEVTLERIPTLEWQEWLNKEVNLQIEDYIP